MVKFDNFSDTERKEFDEILRKNTELSVDESKVQIWPEDDEELTKSYFD